MSGKAVVLTDGKHRETLLTEENFFALQAMGDDPGALLNAAVERFIDEPREKRALKGLDGDIPSPAMVER